MVHLFFTKPKQIVLAAIVAVGSFTTTLAQNIERGKLESTGSLPVKSTDVTGSVKASYVANQDYLYSATSNPKSKKGASNDSLSGFNETAVHQDLLARNFTGSEYIVVMNWSKRDFINKKYKIGPVYGPNPVIGWRPGASPNSGAGSKPIGGGGNVINLAPCVNEDFELTPAGAYSTSNAVTGWTVESTQNTGGGIACAANLVWNPGSPEFSIVATPVLAIPWGGGSGFNINNVNIGNSPLGGTNVARLNDSQEGTLATRMISTFPVTNANTLFQYAYAGSWDGSGHGCCDQPSFTIRLYNCPGQPMGCSSVSLTPPGGGCMSGSGNYTFTGNPSVGWTNWVVNYIDLTPYVGTCITIEVVNTDCTGGAHHGTAYFDCLCGGQNAGGLPPSPGPGGLIPGPVSFCSGANVATINAPIGYATYQWFAPNPNGGPPVPVMGNGGSTPTLSINNPIAGTIYTVELITASGCTYTAIDTLAFSSVMVAGLATSSTCPGGASGSASVAGNGSGAGYTYTWTNSSGVSLGNGQSVGGLAVGVYSITIGALGGGCGTDSRTLSIGQGPPGTYTNIIPFCGSEAYMSATGSNFQWYDGVTLIPSANGGTAGSYTATAPVHGQIYRLSYQTLQGCEDSVTYILSQTPSGSMYVTDITYACPNTPNATALINMSPAPAAPIGFNSYSVTAFGVTPAYNASLYPTSSNAFAPTGLSPGTYSAFGFDGACKYTNTFVVQPYLYDYTVTPNSTTICPGTSIMAGVTFPFPIVPGQFGFYWAPSLAMAPANNDISVILSPTTALGTITSYIYSVTVTPAIVNCPITKTISITAANLSIPNITPFSPFCNNLLTNKTITVSASVPNGTFTTGMPNSPAWLNNGFVTPSNFTAPGTYSFQYAVSFGTCMVSNSSNFNVSIFNTSSLSALSIPNKCVTDPCLNLMSLVQSTVNGVWANSMGVANNVFCPASVSSNATIALVYNTTSSGNPNLCPSTSSITVVVSNTVAPFITPIPPFCTNTPPIQMTVNPIGGTWLYGGPTPLPSGQLISNSGLLVRANAPLGNNTVIYSIVNGACTNTTSTQISATVFRSAALTGSIPDLCYTGSSSVNLMSIVSNTVSGRWVGPGVQQPAGTTLIPSTITNSLNLGITGYYTYKYYTFSAPNPTVCPDSSQITVHVLNPVPPVIQQPPPHCITDAPFQLSVSPNTGYFTATPYLTANGLFSPALSPVGNNQIEYTIGTNTCNAKNVKTISIEAFIPATLTGSLADQCSSNQVINLASLSLNNMGSWSGPGITGSTFDPATSGTGPIVITYNTKSNPSGLCPDSSPLTVNVFSLATPYIEEKGPYCNSMQPVQLIASPLGGVFKGENSPAVGFTGVFNPASAAIGENVISYSVTSGPCEARATSVILIEKFVPADFEKYADPFCRNGHPLDLNSLATNPGGLWSGDGMTGSVFNPANANIGNSNEVTYQTHSYPTATLCPDVNKMKIQVNDLPNVMVVTNKQKGCAPVEVVLNSPDASSTGTGEWYFGDGTEAKKGLSTSYIFNTPGTYTVTFNYRDNLGCMGQATLLQPIQVYELPVAEFSYGPFEEITISDPRVQFMNQTTVLNKNTYLWEMDNLFKTDAVNPEYTFPRIGKYEITLNATSVNGCKAKVSHMIEVKNEFNVYIPNSFTPNADGLNDVFGPVFSPYGLDAKTFEMEIFDRWGKSLYHTKDVTKGWDGSVQNKGLDQLKSDVYVYKIKYKDMEGVVFNKLGHISITR